MRSPSALLEVRLDPELPFLRIGGRREAFSGALLFSLESSLDCSSAAIGLIGVGVTELSSIPPEFEKLSSFFAFPVPNSETLGWASASSELRRARGGESLLNVSLATDVFVEAKVIGLISVSWSADEGTTLEKAVAVVEASADGGVVGGVRWRASL